MNCFSILRLPQLSFVALVLLCSVTFGDVIHDESTDGDLSSDNLSPTSLLFSPGENEIIGTSTFDPLDRDFWTFTIQPGTQLSQVILQDYNSTAAQQSWLAVETGGQVSSVTDASNLLGSALIGFANGASQGDDVLDDVGDALLGGTGFNGPLGAGTYTFWYQETGADTNYSLNFVVQAIPEPGTCWLLLVLSSTVSLRRRRANV